MNLTKLRNNQMQLINFMKEGGYSNFYIDKIKNEINRILKFGTEHASYYEYYEKFIIPKTSLKNQRHKKNFLTIIMNFDLYNEYPNRHHQKHKIIDNSNYSKLNNEYRNIIDTYKLVSLKLDKKTTTIHREALNCCCFLIYLQNSGLNSLNDVSEKDVINFFTDDKNNLKFSSSYEKKIRIVLKTCIPYINECERIVSYFPHIRYIRKNIDYITNDEIEKIKKVLTDKSNNISLRNKALVSILLYTGLRSCEIVNLKLENINWKQEIIEIIQEKTQVNLKLPLTTSVGNAVYNYIKYERPTVELSNIFIREDTESPITKSSVDIAVKKVFKEANIRQNSQKKELIFLDII